VDPLWPLHADISVLVNYFIIIVNIKMKCVYNYRLSDIDWYQLISIVIDYRFDEWIPRVKCKLKRGLFCRDAR